MALQFAIVHYNTPELTTFLYITIMKHHPDATVVLFDNSTDRPFIRRPKNMEYIDNTKGQCLNFQVELAKYPDRYIAEQQQTGSNFGSAKHSMSIQWLFDHLSEPFILCDSDILLTGPVNTLVDNSVACVSDVDQANPVQRIYPFIAYINLPVIRQLGLCFFDGTRMHGLCQPSSRAYLYDTGASFYEDLKRVNSHKMINYNHYIVHYGNGSWRNNKHGPLGSFNISTLPWYGWILQHKHLIEKGTV